MPYGPTAQGFILKPYSQIVQDFEDGEAQNIDPGIEAGAATPLGQLNAIIASAVAEVWEGLQVCYNGLNRDDAEGPALDNIGDLTGDLRLGPKPSSVTCNCTLLAANSPYAPGVLLCQVVGDSTRQFSNIYQVTVAADGVIPVLMACLVDGPTEATAGTITQIPTPVTGWSAVTNPDDATPGALLETDQDYQQRQLQELAGTGACTPDSTQAALLQVSGIVSATVNYNDTDSTVGALTPHSMQCIVYDGSPGGTLVAANVIAQAIWDNKPSGIQTIGTSTGTATDINGNPQTVNFVRPTQVPIYMAYTVTLAPSANIATVAPLVKTLVLYLATGYAADGTTPLPPGTAGVLEPGSEVYALVYRSAALQIPGVVDVPNLALDITPSPSSTANIVISNTGIASISTTNILVNGI